MRSFLFGLLLTGCYTANTDSLLFTCEKQAPGECPSNAYCDVALKCCKLNDKPNRCMSGWKTADLAASGSDGGGPTDPADLSTPPDMSWPFEILYIDAGAKLIGVVGKWASGGARVLCPPGYRLAVNLPPGLGFDCNNRLTRSLFLLADVPAWRNAPPMNPTNQDQCTENTMSGWRIGFKGCGTYNQFSYVGSTSCGGFTKAHTCGDYLYCDGPTLAQTFNRDDSIGVLCEKI